MQKKPAVDTENILLTLDQIDQTIDVMSHVVGKLRRYIHSNGLPDTATPTDAGTISDDSHHDNQMLQEGESAIDASNPVPSQVQEQVSKQSPGSTKKRTLH